MSITYPLSHPTTPGFSSATVLGRSVVAISQSPYTFSQQAQAHPGQRMEMQLSLPPMKRAEAEAWLTFLLKLNGRQGTFLLGDPAATTPRGTIAGTVLVNGAHAVRATALNLKGLTAGTTVLAGDYLQLGSGSSARLHKNLSDATADAGGLVTLDIWPALRSAYSDGAAVVYTGTKGLFRLASNEMPWDEGAAAIYGIDLTATEAL